jgi:hypothetical protein
MTATVKGKVVSSSVQLETPLISGPAALLGAAIAHRPDGPNAN